MNGLAAAEAAFRAGRWAEAEAVLGRLRAVAPGDARAWHLTALVAEQADRTDDALAAFARAAALRPGDPGLAVEHAERLGERDQMAALARLDRVIAALPRHVDARLARGRLLHRAGRYDESRADLLAVYQLAPRRLDGWLARGAMERDGGNLLPAAIAYDHALALAPSDAAALYGRARVALELGADDAVARFAAAARVVPDDRDVAIGEAEAREQAGDEDPAMRLAAMVTADPGWVEGQRLLARMRWEAGDDRFDRDLRAAFDTDPANGAIASALASLLAGVDRHADAADVVAAAAGRGRSDLHLMEAVHAMSAGDVSRARKVLARVPTATPGFALHAARLAIRVGALEEAVAALLRARDEDPWSVSVWAHLGLAWRAIGDPQAEWLHGQPGLVAVHRLGLDDAEMAGIARRLRALHATRRHPAGQSMRGGTQTRGRLLSRQEPMILTLRRAIGEAVMTHWAALPPRDDRHPLLRHRDVMPTLAGSWSVRLGGGGAHVAHIHPEGVLSSASYWVAPPPGDEHQGWLEIGGAPTELALDLPPLARFAPEPGSLVLFPSIAYHSTRPFAAGERITVAFDIAAS